MSAKKLYILSISTILTAGILLVFSLGYESVLNLFKVPLGEKIFIDLRLITAGSELYAKGMDPVFNNPYFSSFTYPRVWYVFFLTGAKEADTILVGIGMISLFFISVCLLPGRLEISGVLMMVVAIFSPAVMFAIERGNVDLALFTLLAFALLAASLPWLSAFLLLIASVFKLYPIFTVFYLISEKKASLWPALAVLGCFLTYALITYQDLLHVFSTTAKGDNFSYGVAVLALKISREIPFWAHVIYVIGYLFAILGGALVFISALKANHNITITDTRNFQAFKLGAAVYIGTFLLGNNWDYRLIFLLFTIPQLSMWLKLPNSIFKWSSIFASLSILFSMWYLFTYNSVGLFFPKAYLPIYLLEQLSQWTLFFSMVYLLSASLPKWILALIPRWQIAVPFKANR